MPPPRMFVDRGPERDSFVLEVAAARAAGEQGVFVFTGLPGVGKTSLALWCAHQLDGPFDVALCVGMGASSQALSVEDALTIFLPQLGVTSLPPTRAAMLATYRAQTAGRTVLLFADDIESAAQLNELLPASAGSVVIATSRRRSEGFEEYGFTTVPVGLFDLESAKQLLTYGMAEVGAEEDLTAVAELCGRLPLALRVARAHLRTRHGGRIAAYAERLRAAKALLAEFTIDGERVVEAVYEVSYQDLKEPEQRLYRLLSVHPGNRFGTEAAAALLGPDHSVAEAEDALQALVRASLLTDAGPGRYELHSLVGQHAAALAEKHEHPADLRHAVRRLVEYYLDFAVARELVLSTRVRWGERFDGRIAPAYQGTGAWDRAAADLERERPNLRRAVRAAVDERFFDLAWQLCEALVTFYFQRDLYADAIAVHGLGLPAAEDVSGRTGDLRPLLRMHAELGTACYMVHDHEPALRHFETSAALAARIDDAEISVVHRAKMTVWTALVHRRLGRTEAAVAAVAGARELIADPRFPAALRARENALLDMNSGPMLAEAGRFDDALAAGRRAVAYLADGTEQHNHAKAMANLGESLALAGDGHRAEAIDVLREALALEQARGLGWWEAHTSELLGDVLTRAGRPDEGRSLLEHARRLFGEHDLQRAEALAARLDRG
jgi:tetratricopeptide (TPR) repeat protein